MRSPCALPQQQLAKLGREAIKGPRAVVLLLHQQLLEQGGSHPMPGRRRLAYCGRWIQRQHAQQLRVHRLAQGKLGRDELRNIVVEGAHRGRQSLFLLSDLFEKPAQVILQSLHFPQRPPAYIVREMIQTEHVMQAIGEGCAGALLQALLVDALAGLAPHVATILGNALARLNPDVCKLPRAFQLRTVDRGS
eukprot:1195159-Prorocentrum_minimum.AAC.5